MSIVGNIYFLKGFPVTQAGTYDVSVLAGPQNKVTMYVDGTELSTSTGAYVSGGISLGAGCHILTAKLNRTLASAGTARFTASFNRPEVLLLL